MYVDDIVVKTKVGSTLVEDLSLVFDRLRATRTKLNPEKCIFGVSAGKLLGFLVSHRGIEANPAKIKAIEAMRPPGRIKDVQKLTGSLAALSRFISRLAERALPFFKLLRRSTTPSGWPTWLSSQRPTGSFGCASTTPASTRHVLETPILFHVSTRSWTPPPGVTFVFPRCILWFPPDSDV